MRAASDNLDMEARIAVLCHEASKVGFAFTAELLDAASKAARVELCADL